MYLTQAQIEMQQAMVTTVQRILAILSSFEESAAECISEMLIFFSNGSPIQGVIQANKFMQHLYALFSSIDEIDNALSAAKTGESIQTSKDPKILVKKVKLLLMFR
jgi:prefoldin subunit 5